MNARKLECLCFETVHNLGIDINSPMDIPGNISKELMKAKLFCGNFQTVNSQVNIINRTALTIR